MVFEAREEWEDPLLDALLPIKGLRRYGLVEVSINVDLYHLDVLSVSDDGTSYVNRYIFCNIDDVVNVIEKNQDSSHTVFLQMRRNYSRNSTYHLQQVLIIDRGKNNFGKTNDEFGRICN